MCLVCITSIHCDLSPKRIDTSRSKFCRTKYLTSLAPVDRLIGCCALRVNVYCVHVRAGKGLLVSMVW